MPYPSGTKRIRFMPKTYTFHARNVYVTLREGYTLQAKGLVTLVLVMLVKMETKLERAGEVGGN